MAETALDRAQATMRADEDDDAARLAFYARLAESELFLLLDTEAAGDAVEPRLLERDGAGYVRVFDTEARLADHAGGVAPQAALSGRALVQMLSGQSLGIALNPGAGASEMLIPVSGVDWLVTTLGAAPQEAQGRPVEIFAPRGVPEALLTALDAKLASARGMAEAAWLVGVRYADDTRGHLLAFVGAPVPAQEALASGVREALIFSGIEAGALDVTFLAPGAEVATRMARVGLRFDLPIPDRLTSVAPGSDPDKPPKLR